MPSRNNQVKSGESVSRSRAKTSPSIISSDLSVQGDLSSEGDIHIEGRVEGNVRGSTITIGPNARVQGMLVSEEVIVRGSLVGNIHARSVILHETAHVEGDILHKTLTIEAGARLSGSIRHTNAPDEQALDTEGISSFADASAAMTAHSVPLKEVVPSRENASSDAPDGEAAASKQSDEVSAPASAWIR